MSAPARSITVLIGLYRALSAGWAPKCRFIPSCSEYAAEAVATRGTWRGLALTARRLARCRPGGGFGYDPVPARPGLDAHDGASTTERPAA